MVRSSFLAVFLHAISLQLRLKGNFSKSLELLFETYQWQSDIVFDKVAERRNFTSYFTSGFTTWWRSHSNFKNSKNTHKKHFVMESVFSIVIGDRLDSSNCLRKLYQRHFSGNLLKVSKQEFFRTSPEKSITWFFISVKILNSNLVTLMKWHHYRSFLEVFPAISEL